MFSKIRKFLGTLTDILLLGRSVGFWKEGDRIPVERKKDSFNG